MQPPRLDENNVNIKFVLNILTIIALAVSAVIWATREHSGLREWTAEQDFVTKEELKEVIKEQYVSNTDFVQLRTQSEGTREDIKKIIKELDKIQEKLDRIKRR